MKKIVLSILAFFICFAGFSQRRDQQICRIGFTYEISQSPNWGFGKPVVTGFIPYTFAEQTGLRTDDVIEAVNGEPTAGKTPEEVDGMLNPRNRSEVTLTISNIATSSREITVKKECKPSHALTEGQLAEVFSMYSLETTSDRVFTCPFKTQVTMEAIDFAQFKTFSFADADASDSQIEITINRAIEEELVKKGMIYSSSAPDFVIETYYFFDKNPKFRGVNQLVVSKEPIYRFDPARKLMTRLPFLHYTSSEAEAEYVLQLGIRFVDKKVHSGRILWECEANELMEEAYGLDEYATIHIPLMCMQYPYVKYRENVPFRLNQKIYNYTGLVYNFNEPDKVLRVEPNSPAHTMGIRARDQILSINGQRVSADWDDLSKAYRDLIINTMDYRDPSTVFTDINGYNQCMYWNQDQYPALSEIFQNPALDSPFTYLFFYSPFISRSGANTCTFKVKRGDEEEEFKVRPLLRTEQMIGLF